MNIEVSTASSESIRGEIDGFAYELLQAISSNQFVYRLTDPTGMNKIVTVDPEAASKLCNNPQAFWKSFIA